MRCPDAAEGPDAAQAGPHKESHGCSPAWHAHRTASEAAGLHFLFLSIIQRIFKMTINLTQVLVCNLWDIEISRSGLTLNPNF